MDDTKPDPLVVEPLPLQDAALPDPDPAFSAPMRSVLHALLMDIDNMTTFISQEAQVFIRDKTKKLRSLIGK